DKIGFKITKKTTVAIQGFGKVGIPAAEDLHAQGAKIIAVSDVSGAIYDKNGIDLPSVIKWTRERRPFANYARANHITNEELFALNVDILIPAAIDGVITKKNADKVQAKIIAEGANGPLTKEAIDILTKKGSFIIPDILCNAGGVIVSYFEWVQGLQNFFWNLEEVNEKLQEILKLAFDQVVDNADKYKVDMKKAAFITASERLQKAMRLRGLFPS
ncbi:MAG: glutamate dehydrogenase, partial [Halobacteriovoraceae bacterium]|nr:glutamate dehydrogenase [Halobacteriovoraceae bacterium]